MKTLIRAAENEQRGRQFDMPDLDFQFWDSNPNIWSKSAQNSLGNLFRFFYSV